MIFSHSCGTEEEPCITKWVLGMRAWISLMRLIAKVSPVGGLVNLYAPWLVPMAMASASTWVALTNCAASLGSVSNWSCDSAPSAPWPSSFSPWPDSSEPRQPSSPSTETPTACDISTTLLVTLTLYSKLEGVLPSVISEPSIITLEKPDLMALMHTAGDAP